MHNSDIRLFS